MVVLHFADDKTVISHFDNTSPALLVYMTFQGLGPSPLPTGVHRRPQGEEAADISHYLVRLFLIYKKSLLRYFDKVLATELSETFY